VVQVISLHRKLDKECSSVRAAELLAALGLAS
jgi:hypothetical protein